MTEGVAATDLQVLLAMFERAGITWSNFAAEGSHTAVSVTALDGVHNLGHPGFAACFYFDAAGALTDVGAWE